MHPYFGFLLVQIRNNDDHEFLHFFPELIALLWNLSSFSLICIYSPFFPSFIFIRLHSPSSAFNCLHLSSLHIFLSSFASYICLQLPSSVVIGFHLSLFNFICLHSPASVFIPLHRFHWPPFVSFVLHHIFSSCFITLHLSSLVFIQLYFPFSPSSVFILVHLYLFLFLNYYSSPFIHPFTPNLSSFFFFEVLSASLILILFHILPFQSFLDTLYSPFPFLILFVPPYIYLYFVHTPLLIIFVYRSRSLFLLWPTITRLPHSTRFIFLLLPLHTHYPLFALAIYVFVSSFMFLQ